MKLLILLSKEALDGILKASMYVRLVNVSSVCKGKGLHVLCVVCTCILDCVSSHFIHVSSNYAE